MEEDILNDIAEDLNVSLKDNGKFAKLSYDDYEPIEINRENFHEIPDLDIKNKIAFIDGGNAEILKAANFSLQFIRIYYTIYQNNKRVENRRYEFYLLVKSLSKDNKIFYKTKVFGSKIIEDFELDSFDKTITQGNSRADISMVGNIARRFSELSVAKELLEKLEKDDIIVLDGSLEAKYTNEEKILDEIHKRCEEKDILLAGLSKTCDLLTDKGSSFIGALSEIQPNDEWFYHPVARTNLNFDFLFAKLNKRSSYIFRVDFAKKTGDIKNCLSLLKSNSKDPVFIGYPYALIEADKFARVSNKELEFFKTRFMIKAGKGWKKISNFLKTKDSHNILDKIG